MKESEFVTVDFVLQAEDMELITRLDGIRPDWWEHHVTLQEYQAEMRRMLSTSAAILGLKLKAVRRLKDSTWLIGHAALQYKCDQLEKGAHE